MREVGAACRLKGRLQGNTLLKKSWGQKKALVNSRVKLSAEVVAQIGETDEV